MKEIVKNQIQYEMKMGILCRWKTYVMLFLLFSGLALIIWYSLKENSAVSPSAMDCFVQIFYGTEELKKADYTSSFYIPKELAIAQIPYFILAVSYPVSEYRERGIQYLLRSKSRLSWWMGKIFWLAVMTVLYYVLLFAAQAAVTGLLEGGAGIFRLGQEWPESIQTPGAGRLIGWTEVMLIVTGAATGIMEIFLALALHPVIAVSAAIGTLAAAVYEIRPWLLENYVMLCRNRMVIGSQGADNRIGIVISCMVMIGGCWLGWKWIRKREFISAEK